MKKLFSSVALAMFLAMVLALSIPATAQADEYADVRELIDSCNGCHGENGASQDDAFPILAGQEFFYLYTQLKDFKRNSRKNEIMVEVLQELDKATLQKLAKFYSEQKWPGIPFKGDEKIIAKGQTATDSGQCVACHLGSYHGNSRVPRLAGQHPNYLEKTMLEMKTKARNNAPAMSSLMSSYSEEDIAAMAEFLGSL